MITSPTLENFTGVSLGGLIPLALLTAILVIMNPVKINEGGFIVKSKGTRTVFTKWEVINWNDIYGIKLTTIIFFYYIRIFCKGRVKPIWIPLSVSNKSKFVEDLIRYIPDENPLNVLLQQAR